MGVIQSNRASKQASARNRAALQQYAYSEEFRKAEWFQQLSVYGARRVDFELKLTENDLAAQRGFTQAQRALNDKIAEAWRRNESKLIEWLQNSGKIPATGITGASIKRMETLDIGALERSAGREVAALTRTKESFEENVEAIRNKQKGGRNKLYSQVAFQPRPGQPTPRPVLESTDPTWGYVSAALGGLSSFLQFGGTFGGGGGSSYGGGVSNPVPGLPQLPSDITGLNPGNYFNPGTNYGGYITGFVPGLPQLPSDIISSSTSITAYR